MIVICRGSLIHRFRHATALQNTLCISHKRTMMGWNVQHYTPLPTLPPPRGGGVFLSFPPKGGGGGGSGMFSITPPSQPPPLKGEGVCSCLPPKRGKGIFTSSPWKGGGDSFYIPSPLTGEGKRG